MEVNAARTIPQVGLSAGDDHKTYSNYGEALEDFWQRTIKPNRQRDADTLRAQYLPLFGLDPAVYRIAFDYSNVQALQADTGQVWTRYINAWSAQGIDLFTLQTGLSLNPDESKTRDVYVTMRGGVQPENLDPTQRVQPRGSGPAPAVKSEAWEGETRDRDGEWTEGGMADMAIGTGIARSRSSRKKRILPRQGGSFEGEPGNSNWVPTDEKVLAVTDGRAVAFKHGFPDFTPWADHKASKSSKVFVPFSGKRRKDFSAADKAYATKLGWTVAKASRYRMENRLTWHHEPNCKNTKMILVPRQLHARVPHRGGFSLCGDNGSAAVKFDPYHGEHGYFAASDGGAGTDSTGTSQKPDHVGAMRDRIEKGLANNPALSPRQIATYRMIAHNIINQMSPEASKQWLSHVAELRYYPDLKSLRDATGYQNTRVEGGLDEHGTLHLDGGDSVAAMAGVHAHEFAHGIDGYDYNISRTAEWQQAWQQEVKDRESLSKYGRQDAHEGFAEFGRLVLSGLRPAIIEKDYPACYAVWRSHKLVL